MVNETILFSFVTHPLKRAMAAYGEAEAGFYMGWLDDLIKFHNLTWWRGHCNGVLQTHNKKKVTYGQGKTYNCNNFTSSSAAAAVVLPPWEVKLRRANAFMSEVIRVGFWEQHQASQVALMARSRIFPMPGGVNNNVYLIELSPEAVKQTVRLLDRTVNNTNYKEYILNVAFNDSGTERNKIDKMQDEVYDSQKQALSPKALFFSRVLRMSKGMGVPKHNQILKQLAGELISKLCYLYRLDVTCLGFHLPECEGNTFINV
jgi:hypothetical protein